MKMRNLRFANEGVLQVQYVTFRKLAYVAYYTSICNIQLNQHIGL